MADSLQIPCNTRYTGYIVFPEGVDVTSVQGKMSFKSQALTTTAELFSLTNSDGLVMAEASKVIDGVTYPATRIVTFNIAYIRALLLEQKNGYADCLLDLGGGNIISSGIITWVGVPSATTPPVAV